MTIKEGDFINSERLGRCKVLRVLPLGTLEVMARSGNCYRVSGLPLQPREPSKVGLQPGSVR